MSSPHGMLSEQTYNFLSSLCIKDFYGCSFCLFTENAMGVPLS